MLVDLRNNVAYFYASRIKIVSVSVIRDAPLVHIPKRERHHVQICRRRDDRCHSATERGGQHG